MTPNGAAKMFNAFTEEGRDKKMVVQICDVAQGLLSVSKVVRAGNRVVYDNENSYIENKIYGERTWLNETWEYSLLRCG